MINEIKIMDMQEVHINDSIKIWNSQYNLYCKSKEFPQYWKEDNSLMEKFLEDKIFSKDVSVAIMGERVVGFLAYDEFPFHGEKSVFCPAIGHAAIEEYKESVYLKLYQSISEKWVSRGIFNHMWTIFCGDIKLQQILFDLGYGSYLIDASTSCEKKSKVDTTVDIRKASIQDIHLLLELVGESAYYYASAPIFLKRDQITYGELEELVVENNVYIAWYEEVPIGFINLSISKENNIFDLTVENSGLIDEIGMYLKFEYRSKGIGLAMLEFVKNYCKDMGIAYLHVDFETANLYGNKFWRKHFKPMLLSMRRTINKDIND